MRRHPRAQDIEPLDNADPATIREVEARIDRARTLFIIASKSGTAAETSTLFRYVHDRLKPQMTGKAGDHLVAITDLGTPLAIEAKSQGFRRCLENPADIGGRYSALSYFGLVPMALLGVDITAFLEHAHRMWVSCGPFIPAEANPGVSLGTLLGLAARQRRGKVTFVPSESLRALGAWVAPLLSTSTGKEGLGFVPVVHEALGTPEGYGTDRVFVSLRLAKDEDAHRLGAGGSSRGPHHHARGHRPRRECFRWEVATAKTGAIVGANPL